MVDQDSGCSATAASDSERRTNGQQVLRSRSGSAGGSGRGDRGGVGCAGENLAPAPVRPHLQASKSIGLHWTPSEQPFARPEQLATASSSPSALHSTEDILYRSLLREVIETRSSQSGSGPAVDLSQLRSEKKKRRDAERGASKGRKIR